MNRYFTVLDVSPNATLKEIKKAYRKKVMLYHPDRNKSSNASTKFIEIDEAYDYLCKLREGKVTYQTNTTYSKPQETKEEKLKKDFLKAEIVKDFMYKSNLLDKEANRYYILICLPSILILPIIGGIIGSWLNSGLLGFILVIGLPSFSIYFICKRVYDSMSPRRKKLSKEMKTKIKSL